MARTGGRAAAQEADAQAIGLEADPAVRRYGWDGGFGTSDPASGLVAILLTQRVFDSPDPPPVHKDFWRDAYAALR